MIFDITDPKCDPVEIFYAFRDVPISWCIDGKIEKWFNDTNLAAWIYREIYGQSNLASSADFHGDDNTKYISKCLISIWYRLGFIVGVGTSCGTSLYEVNEDKLIYLHSVREKKKTGKV